MKRHVFIFVILLIFVVLAQMYSATTARDIESFEIQAIIPEHYNTGDSQPPVAYGELVVRDLYLDDQNVIEADSVINIGRGYDFISESGDAVKDMFIVEYTTNNLSPVNISVAINPFESESGKIIPMTVYSQAGNKFSSREVKDMLDIESSYSKPADVEDNTKSDLGEIDKGEPGIPEPSESVEFSGMRMLINGQSFDNSDFKAEERVYEQKTNQVKENYKFAYEKYVVSGYWDYIADRVDYGLFDLYYNHRYTYLINYEDWTACSENDFVDNGNGYVTNYIKYSVGLIGSNFSQEKYTMNVTVSLESGL